MSRPRDQIKEDLLAELIEKYPWAFEYDEESENTRLEQAGAEMGAIPAVWKRGVKKKIRDKNLPEEDRKAILERFQFVRRKYTSVKYADVKRATQKRKIAELKTDNAEMKATNANLQATNADLLLANHLLHQQVAELKAAQAADSLSDPNAYVHPRTMGGAGVEPGALLPDSMPGALNAEDPHNPISRYVVPSGAGWGAGVPSDSNPDAQHAAGSHAVLMPGEQDGTMTTASGYTEPPAQTWIEGYQPPEHGVSPARSDLAGFPRDVSGSRMPIPRSGSRSPTIYSGARPAAPPPRTAGGGVGPPPTQDKKSPARKMATMASLSKKTTRAILIQKKKK